MHRNYWAHAPQQEEPPEWEALSPQRRVALAHGYYRKPRCSNKDPLQTEKKKKVIQGHWFHSISRVKHQMPTGPGTNWYQITSPLSHFSNHTALLSRSFSSCCSCLRGICPPSLIACFFLIFQTSAEVLLLQRDFPNHTIESSSQFPPLAAPNPISIMLALCEQIICWFIWVQLQSLRAHLNNNQWCKQSGKLVWNFSPDLLGPLSSTPQLQFLYLLRTPPPQKRILLVQLSLDSPH